VRCELQPVQLSERAQITVYRLVQESLTNIAKYAKATEVTVRLVLQGDAQVRVSVRDNGVGFDPKVTQPRAHGLLGMRYRIEAEGGAMTVESGSRSGTTIQATLPAATAPVPAVSEDVQR
jgi:signal transduction histidine kinase